jgi:hypothetical protein
MRSSGAFPSGVPGKRLLLAGVEVNATLLDPKTPQELENRRNEGYTISGNAVKTPKFTTKTSWKCISGRMGPVHAERLPTSWQTDS